MNALSNNTAIHLALDNGIKILCRKTSYGPTGQHVIDSTTDRAAVTCLRCLAKMTQPEARPVAARPLPKRLQALLDSMSVPVSLVDCTFSLYSDMQDLKRRGLVTISGATATRN